MDFRAAAGKNETVYNSGVQPNPPILFAFPLVGGGGREEGKIQVSVISGGRGGKKPGGKKAMSGRRRKKSSRISDAERSAKAGSEPKRRKCFFRETGQEARIEKKKGNAQLRRVERGGGNAFRSTLEKGKEVHAPHPINTWRGRGKRQA